MADKTGIQWTEATWNPIVGCSVISAGCKNCYAMPEAARLERMGLMKYVNLTTDTKVGPVWNGNVALDERSLDQPLRWKRPRLIFVNSMSDLFHEALTFAQIDQVFAVMALAPQHTFQVVTKRSARMLDYLSDPGTPDRIAQAALLIGRDLLALLIGRDLRPGHPGWWESNWRKANGSIVPIWPLPNLWLGVSVEDQDAAEDRIPHLLGAPATLRFLSCEPLLGPVDLRQWQHDYGCGCGWGSDNPLSYCNECGWRGDNAYYGEPCPECGVVLDDYKACPECDGHSCDGMSFGPNSLPRIDWVIVGGESGPRARSCNVEWIWDLVRQCQKARVPVFVKQLGARYFDEENMVGGAAVRVPHEVGRDLSYRLKHRKGADMAEWPEYLRVRQMPEVA